MHKPLVSVHVKDTEKRECPDNKPRCPVSEYQVTGKSFLYKEGGKATISPQLSDSPHGNGLYLSKVSTMLAEGIACMLGTVEDAGEGTPLSHYYMAPPDVLSRRAACNSHLLRAANRAVDIFTHSLGGIDDRSEQTADELGAVKGYGSEALQRLNKLSPDWAKAKATVNEELESRGGVLAPTPTSIGFELAMMNAYDGTRLRHSLPPRSSPHPLIALLRPQVPDATQRHDADECVLAHPAGDGARGRVDDAGAPRRA